MLVLRGRVFYGGRLEPLDIGIEGGTISTIKKDLRGHETVDYGDRILLPGAIDLHVHMRDPGHLEKEDFTSGTRSAALGGVTTVLDMPNTVPAVTTREALVAKRKILTGRSMVDYGLYAAPPSAAFVEELRSADAFKAYMAPSTGHLTISEENLAGILATEGLERKLLSIHAEDPRLFKRPQAKGLEGHAAARPIAAEVRAIETVARLRAKARVHLAHVTCVEALRAVPPGASTEVTPHHLFLDYRASLGGFGKVNPPLRSPRDRSDLWAAFASGRIDVVASDHAPHTREAKTEGPFEELPSGMPGVATALPLLLRRAHAQDLTLERLVSVMCTHPADLLGLQKGLVEVGRDADLVVVNPRHTEKINARRVRYKCGWTAFEGFEGVFPEAVYVRGERIVEGGEAVAEGVGRPIETGGAGQAHSANSASSIA